MSRRGGGKGRVSEEYRVEKKMLTLAKLKLERGGEKCFFYVPVTIENK